MQDRATCIAQISFHRLVLALGALIYSGWIVGIAILSPELYDEPKERLVVASLFLAAWIWSFFVGKRCSPFRAVTAISTVTYTLVTISQLHYTTLVVRSDLHIAYVIGILVLLFAENLVFFLSPRWFFSFGAIAVITSLVLRLLYSTPDTELLPAWVITVEAVSWLLIRKWNAMEERIKAHRIMLVESERRLEEAKRIALESDIKNSQAVQEEILGERYHNTEFYEVATEYRPSLKIGGDWFHFCDIRNISYFFVADVTGHGIAAALVSAQISGIIQTLMAHTPDSDAPTTLHQIALEVNRQLYHGTNTSKLATMVFIAIEHETGTVWSLKAGHPSPLLVSGKSAKALTSAGSQLGFANDMTLRLVECKMDRGDILAIYTDGLLENSSCTASTNVLKKLVSGGVIAGTDLKTLASYIHDYIGSHWDPLKRNDYDDSMLMLVRRK